MQSSVALLAALAAAVQAATPQGFNYSPTKADNSAFLQSDFESLFKQAQNLPGTSGFTSGRLYTMMEAGTNKVTGAIPAAISTKTSLLLGMWVSVGAGAASDSAFKAELAVLKAAVDQYGDQLKGLVDGISVGSEDMYRISSEGNKNANPGPGQEASTIADFIQQTKDYLKGTPLSGVPVGHVDTWSAWQNGTNSDAIKAADFLGVDAYPYWQLKDNNDISNGKSLFDSAMGQVSAVSQGKPLWITETGWGVKGPTQNLAVASTDNAQKYWQQVGCANFGKTPTWWYTLVETPSSTNPDFSIFNAGAGKPYFDLSCDNVQTGSDNSTSTGTSTGVTSTSTGTSTGSGSSNGTVTSGTPSMPSTGSGSGSGSSGSGSSGSGSGSSGSGSGSGSGSKTGSATGSATSAVSTGSASTMSVLSAGSLLAIAAAVAALL